MYDSVPQKDPDISYFEIPTPEAQLIEKAFDEMGWNITFNYTNGNA
jgi:hypothetical protein